MLPGGRSSSQLPQSLAEVIQCRAMNPISLNLKCNRNFQPKLYFTNSTLAIEPLNCYNGPICSKRRELRQVLPSDSESGLGVELAQYLIC